ncbi:hypothetical protein N431DRAFT_524712 [Stipitochalara longipes BDJ]|nr:hypothetical protein N431DRAFT_524712 [Stipitochalara longipes BDJ]
MPRKPLLSFLHPRSPLQNDTSPSSPASPLPLSPSSLTPTNANANSGPQRLHLRTILKSPAFQPLFTATIPTLPYPWIWKCHLCGSIYRLGVTRRCLEDGHPFCSIPSAPLTPDQSSDDLTLSSTPQTQTQKQKSRKLKKKRKAKGCRAEFDYTGWEGYNEWRREIRGVTYAYSASLRKPVKAVMCERGEEYERGEEKRDCWRDCDFPSECLNERVQAREWRERERERMRVLEEWGRERLLIDGEDDAETENKIEDEDEDEDEGVRDEDLEMGGAEEGEFYDAGDCWEGEREKGGVEVEEGEGNLGPLGTDSDGLGEEGKEAKYSACRRKSLDAGIETPPSNEAVDRAGLRVGVYFE